MKKVILILAFVFASSSLMNAKNNIEPNTNLERIEFNKLPECYEEAIQYLEFHEYWFGEVDDLEAAEIMNNYVGICWLNGGEI